MSPRFLFLLCACTALVTAAEDPTAGGASPFDKTHANAATTVAWPEVRRETKPWTRWWWLGNIADEKTLTSEMERYAAAGLGGLEITPIYGVRGYEERFVPFLSERWVQLFDHTLAEARRLDLGIDLATGTGWPFGGPWLSQSDAAHYLAHKAFRVAPGATLTEPVAFTQRGLVRTAGARKVSLDELPRPVTTHPDLQDLALDQVRFEESLPLVSLMAFPSTGAPLDLTSRVRADGHLDWTAPTDAGEWTLYALFDGPHGKMVERAAPGGEGLALDHFSSRALETYLAQFTTAFAQSPLSYDASHGGFRAFFNDSYEVDDGDGEANWTPRFLEEFEKRRGYDLRHHLPALFDGPDTRVLTDYRETISDLLRDEFTVPWRKWANSRGALIRNQAHNAPANVLDLYAASDIPEQEGNGYFAMKLASSAAHLTGKSLASAETATWLNEHFLTTLAELKDNADTFLLAGINHLCYHGTPFSPPDDPWPGFQFYASVELSPANPLWQDFPALNTYITRVQSFLQSGRPDEDVLLYYNIHDTWAKRGDGTLPHFGHGGQDPVGVTAGAVATELHAAGVGFDFVSDRLLQQLRSRDELIESGDQRYHAIVVPAVEFMPATTLEKLVQLAERGATILVVNHLPKKSAGLRGDSEFSSALRKIQASMTTHGGITAARVGRGQFLVGESLSALLEYRSGMSRETMGQLGLEFIRRRADNGFIYLVVNRSREPIDRWVPFAHIANATLFDPMTGQFGRALTREREIYLQLAPGESRIVRTYRDEVSVAAWPYWQRAGDTRPLSGEWSLTFQQGGPALPEPATLSRLVSWTDLANASAKVFSGTASYELTFPRPTDAEAWSLDLGTVQDSARIKLNGRDLTTLIQPPWRIVILSDTLRPTNTLEVTVTNLGANRLADLDRRGVPWKKFYNANMPARRRENVGPDGLFTAAHWAPRASGLLGPVTLTPLRKLDPSR